MEQFVNNDELLEASTTSSSSSKREQELQQRSENHNNGKINLLKSFSSVDSDEITRTSSCICDENDFFLSKASCLPIDGDDDVDDCEIKDDNHQQQLLINEQDNSVLSFVNDYNNNTAKGNEIISNNNKAISEWIHPNNNKSGGFQHHHQVLQSDNDQQMNYSLMQLPDLHKNSVTTFQQLPSSSSSLSLFANCIRGTDTTASYQEVNRKLLYDFVASHFFSLLFLVQFENRITFTFLFMFFSPFQMFFSAISYTNY
jgi:hypothetical protein